MFLHSKLAPSNIHPLARLYSPNLPTVDLHRVVTAEPRSVYPRLGVGLTVGLHLSVTAQPGPVYPRLGVGLRVSILSSSLLWIEAHEIEPAFISRRKCRCDAPMSSEQILDDGV